MKLIDQLEIHIKNGDWAGVCEVYNKLTGKNIIPPDLIPVFDYKKAKKQELYNELTNLIPLQPIKLYNIEDLRDMWEMQLDVEPTEITVSTQQFSIAPQQAKHSDSAWINPKAHGRKGDSISHIKADPADLEKLGKLAPESTTPATSSITKRPTNMIMATCRSCGKKKKVSRSIAILGGEDGGEAKFICTSC